MASASAYEFRDQNAVSVTTAIPVAIGKNRFNAKIILHIPEKAWFDQLKIFLMRPFHRGSVTV